MSKEPIIPKANVDIKAEPKLNVTVYKSLLPEPYKVTIKLLAMKFCNELRYRFELQDEDNIDARISVSGDAHYQENEPGKFYKCHKNKSIYIAKKGWLAILIPEGDSYQIKIAFAHCDDFYVEVPGGKSYLVYLPKGTAWEYASSDTESGSVSKWEKRLLSEQEILSAFGEQEKLSGSDISHLVTQSFTPKEKEPTTISK